LTYVRIQVACPKLPGTLVRPTAYSVAPASGGLLWHLTHPGVDINDQKGPYLAGPPASDGPLWPLPHPGEDKNGRKVPYLDCAPASVARMNDFW